jgi:hypothetical protein
MAPKTKAAPTGVLAEQANLADIVKQLQEQLKASNETNAKLMAELTASRGETALLAGRGRRAARDISDKINEGDEDGRYTFEAMQRCQVEGIYMEPGQKITLGKAAAHRMRRNLNLTAITGVPPVPPAGKEYKEDREDPRVTEAPPQFRLIQQAGQPQAAS